MQVMMSYFAHNESPNGMHGLACIVLNFKMLFIMFPDNGLQVDKHVSQVYN